MGSYGSYNMRMKSVGIKILKNKLSSYLDLVRRGERVLVTDRDEVIAEIRPPSFIAATPLEAFLTEAQTSGALTLPESSSSFQLTSRDLLEPLPHRTATEALEDLREDRY